jgi:hypothetical protein
MWSFLKLETLWENAVQRLRTSLIAIAFFCMACTANGYEQPTKRHPAPTQEQLDESRIAITRLFGGEISEAKSLGQKTLLSEKLLETAVQTNDDSVARYALLKEAYQLAVSGGSVNKAFRAADLLAAEYEPVDLLGLKSAACKTMSSTDYPVSTARDIAEATTACVAAASHSDDYKSGGVFLQAGQEAAKRLHNAKQLQLFTDLSTQMQALKAQHEQYLVAIKSLGEKPNDSKANEIAGKYLCLKRGTWVDGEQYLSRSDDSKLRQLATSEFKAEHDPITRRNLADAWWDYSQSQSGVEKSQAQEHAAAHYRAVQAELSGLTKLRIQERLQLTSANPFSLLSAVSVANKPDIFLADLKEEFVKGWEYNGLKQIAFGKRAIWDSDKWNPIVLAGKESPNGLASHPTPNGNSVLRYKIGGLGKNTFRATAGVADVRRYGPHSPLTFKVIGDGKELWKSTPVTKWGQPQDCKVPVSGVDTLELKVECPGDAGFSFSVWCEPRLTDD